MDNSDDQVSSRPNRPLEEFDAAIHRLLDSTFEDARDNIKRLLAVIRKSSDLAEILAAVPPRPPFQTMELPNLLMQNYFSLPTEPSAELGVVMQILLTIAEAEDVPFINYVWEPDAHPRDVIRKYISPSMDRLRRDLAARVAARQTRESLLGTILLENEHKELLTTLVEASRNVPPTKRQTFHLSRTLVDTSLHHDGLPDKKMAVLESDLGMLRREGLLAMSVTKTSHCMYDVTPKGYRYYSYLRERSAEPLERVSESITGYLSSAEFAASCRGSG